MTAASPGTDVPEIRVTPGGTVEIHVHLAPAAPPPDRWDARVKIAGAVAGVLAGIGAILTPVVALADDEPPSSPPIIQIQTPEAPGTPRDGTQQDGTQQDEPQQPAE